MGDGSSKGSPHALSLWPALSQFAVVAAAAAESSSTPYKHLWDNSADSEGSLRAVLEEDLAWRGYAPVTAALAGVDFAGARPLTSQVGAVAADAGPVFYPAVSNWEGQCCCQELI